jgi:hypothetical protein
MQPAGKLPGSRERLCGYCDISPADKYASVVLGLFGLGCLEWGMCAAYPGPAESVPSLLYCFLYTAVSHPFCQDDLRRAFISTPWALGPPHGQNLNGQMTQLPCPFEHLQLAHLNTLAGHPHVASHPLNYQAVSDTVPSC